VKLWPSTPTLQQGLESRASTYFLHCTYNVLEYGNRRIIVYVIMALMHPWLGWRSTFLQMAPLPDLGRDHVHIEVVALYCVMGSGSQV
jgi:hypothetical protein